ncbi:hypothetical protein [Paludisphaera mucosa]|uniref:Uncharacterized protein n=1 Tax=Paludisphaera mucosa TaxID=3030827 RepID=A0ABT6FHD5_9BACT|nr:hypothetical protein [Paludisphaera mucosa]MDG3006805.1 hypothetical protein [Paludisphaera mucosa]
MRRTLLGVAACFLIVPGSSSLAQGVGEAPAYGGFGGQYVQAPSLYYPYPGIIESRFGTYFSVPVMAETAETPIEAATIDATNAAQLGIEADAVDPKDVDVAKAKDAAKAKAAPVAAKAALKARVARKPAKVYARGYDREPAPFRRVLPRGNLDDLNNAPAGIPTYSPYARYQAYGQAYGMGPYGSNFYSNYWHGYAPASDYAAPTP